MNLVALAKVKGMKYLVTCQAQFGLELRAVHETMFYVRLRAEFAASMSLESLQILPTNS